MNSDVNINLRAESAARDLIDEAAKASGKSRTDFMLSSALRDAQDVLLDRTSLVLDADSFSELMDQLDKGSIGDVDRAQHLLQRPKAWD